MKLISAGLFLAALVQGVEKGTTCVTDADCLSINDYFECKSVFIDGLSTDKKTC